MKRPVPSDPLAALQQQLDAAKASARTVIEGDSAPSSASHAMRVGIDLVSGVAVGTAIGYALDRWLGTMPLFMLVCMGIGTAAGVKLMMEAARKAAEAIEAEDNDRQATNTTPDH